MSSPHLGGGFLPIRSGRSTPALDRAHSPGTGGGAGTGAPSTASSSQHSFRAGAHPQLSYPRPQPIGIANAPRVRGSSDRGGSRYDSEDEEEQHVGRSVIGAGSWRPVGAGSPRSSSHALGSSPRNSSHVLGSSPRNAHYLPSQFASSSRVAHEEAAAIAHAHIHAAGPGRLPSADPESQFIGTEAADYAAAAAAAAAEAEMGLGGDHHHHYAYAHDAYVAPAPVRFSELPVVLKGYLVGQIANVIKFGLWWVAFTSLILALFGGNSYLVGATRICFNLALLICSPLAGGLVERTNIKRLLNRTVATRGLIYCVAIPLAWLLLDSELWYTRPTGSYEAFFGVFLVIVFLDGVAVSFSNVADIDSGGVNLVAAQYGLEIDDNIRAYFNALHILFFDLSMVLFNPVLAYIGLLIGQQTVRDSHPLNAATDNAVDEVTMLVSLGGVFFLSTMLTLISYSFMPDLERVEPAGFPFDQSMQQMDNNNNFGAEDGSSLNAPPPAIGLVAPHHHEQLQYPEPDVLSWSSFKDMVSSVREGASITWSQRRIRWRVLFFAVETSLEDAMIALVAAEVGAHVFAAEVNKGDEELKYAWGSLWAAGLVSVGKFGGVLASLLMHRYFVVDDEAEARDPGVTYRPLFWCAFLGGTSALLLPVALHLRDDGGVSNWAIGCMIFAAMFLFFFFSTLSKIGFSTLMQSMAAEVDATAPGGNVTGRVFGFVAAFVTATDALVLMALASLFSALSLQVALWAVTGFIAAHGIVELILGPRLVLRGKHEGPLDQHFLPDAGAVDQAYYEEAPM